MVQCSAGLVQMWRWLMRGLCHRIQTVSIVRLTGVFQPSWLGVQIPSAEIRGSKSRGFAVKGLWDRGLAEKGLEERVSVREGNGDRGLAEKGLEQIRACARTHMLTDSIQRERTLRPDSEQMGLGTSQWVCRFQKQSSYYCTISYVLVETLLMMIMILLCHHCLLSIK